MSRNILADRLIRGDRFSRLPQSRSRAMHSRNGRALRMEPLEDRTVLTAVFTVNSTLDAPDANPGDGMALAAGGVTTLRAAIEEANALGEADEILFSHQAWGTILLDSMHGQLEITDDLTITGPGAHRLAVSGNGAVRAFYVGLDTTAIISGLTITDGLANENAPIIHSLGGGILNDVGADLTLTEVVVSHNQAVGAASDTILINGFALTGSGVGGGVANLGNLVVSGSTFDGNGAQGASATVSNTFPGSALGGGLANVGTATVTDSQFTSNLAQAGSGNRSLNPAAGLAGDAGGGAIMNAGLNVAISLDVSGSRFSHNRAIAGNDNSSGILPGHSFGGAIGSLPLTRSATLNISESRFDHNQSIAGNHNVVTSTGNPRGEPNMSAGGGVFAQGSGTISDSTFDHNEAFGGQGIAGSGGNPITVNGGDGRGGGIAVAFMPTVVTISNCTITHNLAMGGQAGVGGTGGSAWGGGVGNSFMGAMLTITGGVVDHNLAQGGSADASGAASSGGDGLGGGVFNRAGSRTDVIASFINHNRAFGGAGSGGGNGGNGRGGGFYNLGTTELSQSVIEFNKAKGGAGRTGGDGGDSEGGGLYNGGTATLTETTITRNNAKGGPAGLGGDAGTGIGGGVYNNGPSISIDDLDLIFANMADEFDDIFGYPI